MRIGALVALLCVAGCRARPQETTVLQSDSVDLAQLVPRDSTDGTLLIPRVVTEPSVVLFWLRAADTLAADDRAVEASHTLYDTLGALESVTTSALPNGSRLSCGASAAGRKHPALRDLLAGRTNARFP